MKGRKKSLKWSFHDRDMEFLRDVGMLEMKAVAQKHNLASSASAQQVLNRIRLRLTRCQNYCNEIRGLQKNARIRKKTTSDRIPQDLKMQSYSEETKLQEEERIE